ncbi:unnamed protein product [Paramecium sonneborni]|uniref:Tetratricopeptide repeat protein n=1 Tax=Paramecium sonneborni TaxID=65129 RepID=A0A8S1Q689_9CILI|nr:unnamed protein product [Paramecium sonneborni]
MKSLSIKNIFEFKDNRVDGVKENLYKNINQLKGLGVPDVCIITKQQQTNLIKTTFETQSSFHFVQGLCPQSQAEIFAYLQTILQNQEIQEYQTLFSKVPNISKLSYLCYDIFTKTILVCEIQLSIEGLQKSKIFAVQENEQYILPSQQHWQGAYISNILRAIDDEFKLASVGRFFNNINLKNNSRLIEVISMLLSLISIQPQLFQDLDKISSINNFPEIKDALHYLCWPLDILATHLNKSNQLDILIKELENIEDNTIFYLIKSILYYKMKNYEKSLSCLVNISQISNQFNFIKYMFGKVLIKLGKFQQALIMLKDTLIKSYENQIIWITMASIFRKQNHYQICLNLLNKAASFQGKKIKKNLWREIHIQNYRVMSQDNKINNLHDLDKVYTVINPLCVDKVESFSQLSNHPVLEQLLLRHRNLDKKELKIWHTQALKFLNQQGQKIEKQTIEFISQNQLLENKQELSLLQEEIIRLSIKVGHEKLNKYLQLHFYTPPHSSYSLISNNVDITSFEIKLKQTNHKAYQHNFQKSLTTMSLCDFDSDEEEEPEFLKLDLNKSLDSFSNIASKTNLQTTKSQMMFSTNKKSQNNQKKEPSKTYSVIQENAYESIESERDDIYKLKGKAIHNLQNKNTMETLSEQSIINEQKVQIYGYIDHLENSSSVKQTEMEDLMKRKKDTLNPILQDFINYISQTFKILEELFYNNSQKSKSCQNSQQTSFNCSEKQSPKQKLTKIFKSQLKESLKNKNYLEKQIEIQDFYVINGLQFKDLDEQQTYLQFIKQESIFLYKCSKIAMKLKKFQLSQKLLEKLNERVISVQISYSLLNILKDDHVQLIQLIQKNMTDFIECGVSKIQSMPIWIEIHLVRLIKTKGPNHVLGLLGTLENYDTFQLIKKIVLQAENLL